MQPDSEVTQIASPSFRTVDYIEFARLRRLDADALYLFMRENNIDGVQLADDPAIRIVA